MHTPTNRTTRKILLEALDDLRVADSCLESIEVRAAAGKRAAIGFDLLAQHTRRLAGELAPDAARASRELHLSLPRYEEAS